MEKNIRVRSYQTEVRKRFPLRLTIDSKLDPEEGFVIVWLTREIVYPGTLILTMKKESFEPTATALVPS